jgi:hypothetical protein
MSEGFEDTVEQFPVHIYRLSTKTFSSGFPSCKQKGKLFALPSKKLTLKLNFKKQLIIQNPPEVLLVLILYW